MTSGAAPDDERLRAIYAALLPSEPRTARQVRDAVRTSPAFRDLGKHALEKAVNRKLDALFIHGLIDAMPTRPARFRRRAPEPTNPANKPSAPAAGIAARRQQRAKSWTTPKRFRVDRPRWYEQLYQAAKAGEITSRDYHVGVAIGRFLNRESGDCTLTISTLAQDTGLSMNTVRASIKTLAAREQLHVMERRGRENANVYTPILKAAASPPKHPAPVGGWAEQEASPQHASYRPLSTTDDEEIPF